MPDNARMTPSVQLTGVENLFSHFNDVDVLSKACSSLHILHCVEILGTVV